MSTDANCERCYFGDAPDCAPRDRGGSCPYYTPLDPAEDARLTEAKYAEWMLQRIQEYEEQVLDGFDLEVLEALKTRWLLYRRD